VEDSAAGDTASGFSRARVETAIRADDPKVDGAGEFRVGEFRASENPERGQDPRRAPHRP